MVGRPGRRGAVPREGRRPFRADTAWGTGPGGARLWGDRAGRGPAQAGPALGDRAGRVRPSWAGANGRPLTEGPGRRLSGCATALPGSLMAELALHRRPRGLVLEPALAPLIA